MRFDLENEKENEKKYCSYTFASTASQADRNKTFNSIGNV